MKIINKGGVMPNFSEMPFEYIDAEEESRYTPEVFEKIFVDRNNIAMEIVKPNKYIIYASKGAGKSAIAHKLQMESKLGGKRTVDIDDLHNINYEKLNCIDALQDKSNFVSAFKFLFLIKIITKLCEIEGAHSVNSHFHNFTKALDERGLIRSGRLTTIIDDVSTRGFTAGFGKVLKCTFEGEKTKRLKSPDSICEAIQYVFEQIKSVQPLWIFLDGIDYVIRFGDSVSVALADMINAVRDINNFFYTNDMDIKLIPLIRHELLIKISHPDLMKRTNDNGVYVGWYESRKKPFEYDLLQVVEKRASLVGYQEPIHDLFSLWFPSKVDGKDAEYYILERTRFLPRDLVMFFRKLQEVGKEPPFSAEDIYEAADSYSHYFLQELTDSINGVISDKIVGAIPDILTQCGVEFTHQDFYSKFKRAFENESYNSATEVLKKLFDTSWIGNRRYDVLTKKNIWNWKSRKPLANLKLDQNIYVHPGLHPVLNLQHL